MTARSGRALFNRSCTRARIPCGGSSHQPKGREGLHCRTCVLAVTDTLLKTTSGRSRQGTATSARRRSSASGGVLHVADNWALVVLYLLRLRLKVLHKIKTGPESEEDPWAGLGMDDAEETLPKDQRPEKDAVGDSNPWARPG